jgi:prefoldin subunit 5
MEHNEIKEWFDMAFGYLMEGDFALACECFQHIIDFSKDPYASNIARRDMEWWCFPVKALVERLSQIPHPVTLEELLKESKLDKDHVETKQYINKLIEALKQITKVYLIDHNLWVYTDHLKQSLRLALIQIFQNREPTTLIELVARLFVERGYQLPLKPPVITSIKSFLSNIPEVIMLESECVFSPFILQDFVSVLIKQIRATQQPASLFAVLQSMPWSQSVIQNLQVAELMIWLRKNPNPELIEITPEFWFLNNLIDLSTFDLTPIISNLYKPIETIDILRHYFFPTNNELEPNEKFLDLQTERLARNPFLTQIGENSWIAKQGYQALLNELLARIAQSERPQTIQELLLALMTTHPVTEDLQASLAVSFAKQLEESPNVIRLNGNTWLDKKAFPLILDRAHEFLSERGPNSIVHLIEECLGITVKGMTISANFIEEFQNELEQDDRFMISYEGSEWLAIPPGNRINNLAYQILHREHCPLYASELSEESRRMRARAIRFQLTVDERFKQGSDGRWMLANWVLINDLAAAYLAKGKIGLIASDVLLKIGELNNIPIVQAVFDPTGDPRFKRDPWGRWHCESAGKVLTCEMLDKLVQVATYDLEWGVPLERLIRRTFNEPPANFFNLEKTILGDGRMIYCEGLWYPKEPCLQQVTPDQVRQVKAYLAEKKYPLSGIELAQTCLQKPICLTNLEEVLAVDPEVIKIGSVGWALKVNQPESMGRPRLINSPVRSGKYTPSFNSIQLTEVESTSQQPGKGGLTSESRPRPHHMTITVTFEDLRDGTLVITSAMRSLLDSSIELPTLKFTDEQRNEFVCWCDLTNDLLYGLADWFKTHAVNFGDKIRLGIKKTEGEFSIEVTGQHNKQVYLESLRRSQLEDLRQEAIRANRSYQDLTLEVLDFFKTPLHIDDIWALVDHKRSARKSTISNILSSRPYFVSVGDGYWRFDEEEYARMISHLENQVKKLQEENQKLNTEIKSLMQPTSQLEKLQHQVEGLQIDLAVAQQAERQAREMQTQLENESDTLKSLLKQQNSELDLLKTDLAAQRDQTKQINTELESTRSGVQQLRGQLMAQERENHELRVQLNDETAIGELLKSDLNERRNEIQVLYAELENEKLEKKKGQERLTAKQQENHELRAALDERMSELVIVKASIETIKNLRAQTEEREQKLKVSLDQAHSSIIILNAELEKRAQVIASLEQAIHDLSAKIESCEGNYTQIKRVNEEQVARNHELKTALKQVGSELEKSKSRCLQLETEITQADMKIHSGQEALNELGSRYVALNESYTQATSELKSLKSQAHVTSAKNIELQARNAHIEAQLQDRIKEVDALSEQIHVLQKKLSNEMQEKQKLEDSIRRVRLDYDSLHTDNLQNQVILNSFPGRFAKWWTKIKCVGGRR